MLGGGNLPLVRETGLKNPALRPKNSKKQSLLYAKQSNSYELESFGIGKLIRKRYGRHLPSISFWCEKRDLNPYGVTTRPSNVRVCQFRHSRIFCRLSATDSIIHYPLLFVNTFFEFFLLFFNVSIMPKKSFTKVPNLSILSMIVLCFLPL